MFYFDKLKEAIGERKVVTFIYDGFPREVEPFLIGDTTSMNAAMRGFQIGGGSKSGNPVGWRLFLLERIRNLSVTETHFSGVRPGYNPSDKAMCRIFVHI